MPAIMAMASRVELWPIDRLRPYERNARTHSQAQVMEVAASMLQFGFTNPILVDSNDGIVAGHCRLRAAQRLGLTQVPVVPLDHLTDAQRRAYILADNKLAENAGWDEDLLTRELADLRNEGFDIGSLGFSGAELEQLFATETDDAPAGQVDQCAELQKKWNVARGQRWQIGPHVLVCGDATVPADVELLLGTAKPFLMVTDPPYGVDYDPSWRAEVDHSDNHALGKVANDDRADWREAYALFPGDVMYVWHAGSRAAEVQHSIEAIGFHVRAQIIWSKQHFQFSRGDYHWQHEPCWYAVRKGARSNWCGDRTQATVWQIANMNPFGGGEEGEVQTGHGTQKPVELMRRPIRNHTAAGALIYDPFLGSGTTMVAAHQLGRICYGMEIAPEYCAVVLERLLAMGLEPRLAE